MADLIFVSIIVAFFALCVVYLRWCDRIIGADDFTTASVGHGGFAGRIAHRVHRGGRVIADRRVDRQLGRPGHRRRRRAVPVRRAHPSGALLMSWQAIVQALVLVALLAVTVPFLGRYMADVYGARDDGSAPGDRFFGPIERADLPDLWDRRQAGAALERLRNVAVGVQPRLGPARCTPCTACRASCRSTRPTATVSARWARSTPRSASSPTPTGSGTRAK